jgi:RNA polymerase sigma-70 factor (ECF subfamily)
MEHHATFLFHYAIGFTKQKESAEEIVSDVFFEVWKLRKMLPDIENLHAWLCTITYRKSISYLRKNDGYDNISFDDIDNFFFEPVQSPDETIIAKEEIDAINKAIQMLPSKCRHVFFLAKIEGLPYKEIAQMLNISVKTINNHIASALEKIRGYLKDNADKSF